MRLFIRYTDYSRGIGSNGFGSPMTWENLKAWREECEEEPLCKFERDCFFAVHAIHQEIAARKAKKPEEGKR